MKLRAFTFVEPGREVLLRHWIHHYTSRVDQIHIFIHCDGRATVSGLCDICDETGIEHSLIQGVFDCQRFWKHATEHVRVKWDNCWIVPVDVDEFVGPEFDLRELAARADREGAFWVRGWMCDRHALGGGIPELSAEAPIYKQFPVRTSVTRALQGSSIEKCIMARWPYPGEIHSFCDSFNHRVLPDWPRLDHFKWHGNVVERLRARIRDEKETGKHWVWQHEATLKHLEDNGGFDLPKYTHTACVDIHGWFDFHGLYSTQVARCVEGGHFVEVGTFLGKSAVYLAEMVKAYQARIVIDLVDPWRTESCYESGHVNATGSFLGECVTNLRNSEVLDYVNIIQFPSPEASALYRDGQLDFVFIDGSHDHDSVYRDVKSWYGKVKFGGVLAGHDIGHHGVRSGLEAALAEIGEEFEVDGACWKVVKVARSESVSIMCAQ